MIYVQSIVLEGIFFFYAKELFITKEMIDSPCWCNSWLVEFYCDQQRSQTKQPSVWKLGQILHCLTIDYQTKYPSENNTLELPFEFNFTKSMLQLFYYRLQRLFDKKENMVQYCN